MIRQRILIADDNRDTVESFAALLSLEGHEVVSARNGVEALALFNEFSPDIVVLDISMPLLDGREVARLIRAQTDRRVLLIALSGWARCTDIARSLQSGFDHHLIKPVEFRDILRLLRYYGSSSEGVSRPLARATPRWEGFDAERCAPQKHFTSLE
jgi:CheY-like chemotaxis protein